MDEQEIGYLNKFYSLLQDNLTRKKALKSNSVLISFLQTLGADRYKYLKNSTLPSYLIPDTVSGSLLEKGLIQCVEKIDALAITAEGVWVYEKRAGLINEKNLLTYINEKYFISKINKNLSLNEKVILLTMIAARAFSEESAINLKKSDTIKDRWQEILVRAYDFIVLLGAFPKNQKESFLDTGGNMHPVSSLFRHNTKMVQKTFGYYKYNRKEEYYLEVFQNSNLSLEKLSYLFWQLFKENDLSQDSINLIANFCNEISNKESIYLFDMDKHIFSLPKYDIIIKDALLDSFMHKQKWEKAS